MLVQFHASAHPYHLIDTYFICVLQEIYINIPVLPKTFACTLYINVPFKFTTYYEYIQQIPIITPHMVSVTILDIAIQMYRLRVIENKVYTYCDFRFQSLFYVSLLDTVRILSHTKTIQAYINNLLFS